MGYHDIVRRCATCGANINHRGPRAIRCEECAKKKAHADRHKHSDGSLLLFPTFSAEDYPNDLKQCEKCKFWANYGSYCNYSGIVGRTRLALHGGNLKDMYPCTEFEPKGGRRNGMDY